jgi:superfamily II DNA or RNA helicase
VLRDYQIEAIANVRARMAEGSRRVVLVMPTGSGKTMVGGEVVRLAVERRRCVLWLSHRTELIGQACAALNGNGYDVGAIAASSGWPVRPGAAVQVASIQTLLARDHRPPAHLIVWDECHHASENAAEWASILEAYPDAHVLGLTATPERGDGSGLAPMFTSLVVGASVRMLTEAGHLVPCEVVRPERWLKEGRVSGNPLSQPPLAAYREHAPGRQGFLFARSVEEAEGYAREFTEAGYRAECVSERTSKADRQAAIDGFRCGTVRILCNVYVFTEGVDLPMAKVCIFASGCGTAGNFLQKVGRVLRPWPGESSAMLIDLPGVSHLHGMPEDERVYQLEGRGISKAGAQCKVCASPLVEYPCSICGYQPEDGEGRDVGKTEITNDPLVKFARVIARSPQQRWETLLRWLASAKLKGHSPRSVAHKWRAVFGAPVNPQWYLAALDGATEMPT